MKIEMRELTDDASVSEQPTLREYDSQYYSESRIAEFRDEIVEQIPNLVEWSAGHREDVEYDNKEYSKFQREVMELDFMERYWLVDKLEKNDTQRFFHRCGKHGFMMQHAQTIWANWYAETQNMNYEESETNDKD